MSKRLGVSIGFLSALAFFLGWYSFTWMIVFMIAVFFLQGEDLLKKNVLNAFFLGFIFLIIDLLFGKVSGSYMDLINNLACSDAEWLVNFDTSSAAYKVLSGLNISKYIVGIAKFVYLALTIVFGIIALKGNEVKVPLCNGFASKVMGVVAKAEAKKDDVTNDTATLNEIPKE